MSRGKRMCPNEVCDRYGVETGLMGGCDCGVQLVPYRSRDQQIDDALWDLTAPTMKRLVGYVLFAQMDAARRRDA